MLRTWMLTALLTAAALFPSISAAPVIGDDDAGSGRDAPDTIAEAMADPLVVQPGVVYEGYDDFLLDPSDFYSVEVQAGETLVIDVAGLIGCMRLYQPDGAQAPAPAWCANAHADVRPFVYRATASGLWHFSYNYVQPEVYRFSVGIDERGPSPYLTPPLLGDFGTLPPVAPAAQTDEHVVVAVVDTGINPYHQFFRAPALADHPSTWLAGFPSGAASVALTLNAADYASARAADAATWSGLQRGVLYTFPGTRVVGAISFSEYSDTLSPPGTIPVLDENGHGTHSAGLAAGADLPSPDGNVLIVMVETDIFSDGVAWAAQQPWIDAISVSAGSPANAPLGNPTAATRAAVQAGKPIFIASGNGVSNTGRAPDHCTTYTSPWVGPSWVTRVGAADPDNSNPTFWHCLPVDVVAHTHVPSPAADSMHDATDASGTSASAPNAGGAYAQLLLDAKRSGLGSDRFAVRQHLYNASQPAAPAVGLNNEPSLAATAPLDQGYGLVDGATLARAIGTLHAGAPTPRPELDAWLAADRDVRVALWGNLHGSGGATGAAQDDAGTGRDAGGDASGAIPVLPGNVYHGFINGVSDDADWYSFSAAAGQTVHARAQGVVGCFYLHAPNGTQMDFACTFPGLPAEIDFALGSTGTWHLKYSYFDPHKYDFAFGLDAPAPELPLVPGTGVGGVEGAQQDDAASGGDAGDEVANATPVLQGNAYHGFVDFAQDREDWYSFQGTSGQAFSLRAEGVVGCVYLFAPSGAQAASTCAFPGVPAALDLTLAETGTWSFRYLAVLPHGYDFGFGLDAPAPALPSPPNYGP